MKRILKILFISSTFIISSCDVNLVHEHTFSREWSADEQYHWHAATCEHQDVVSDRGAHNFVKGETVEPTKDAKGYTVYTCKTCDYSKHDDFVDYTDKYDGRIKSKDFRVINLSYEKQDSNDPRYFDEAKPLSTYLKSDTYKLYYLDEINDVYYLPLQTYVDLFKGDFKDGVVNTVTEENGVTTRTSKLDTNTYTLSIDKNEETITVKGNIEEYFKPIPNGRNGLYDQTSATISYVQGHEEKAKTFSFKEYGFDIFEADGKTCYPFALIACETSKYVERKFVNLSKHGYLVEYVAAEQYNDFSYLENDREVNFFSMMKTAYLDLYGVEDGESGKVVKAPKSLTEFNKRIIYYLFDNYYGLASVKGINKMSSYFDNLGSSKNFTDTDGVIRGSGYNFAIQGMNDLHTGYGYSPFMSEGPGDNAIPPQSFYKDRMNLKNSLSSLRDLEIEKYNAKNGTDLVAKQVRYSEDGKYAYFSFDEFNTFTTFVEGDIPEDVKFADTYYQFVKNLNEIKAKGTVKRVFIDDSCNGGGYVLLMGKLLALLSKDNKSVMYLRDQSDDSIQAYTIKVDSDNNRTYDENDCFGNDFKFYIISSSFSFSCGNAFPFYAEKNGLARIIGTDSGGGECCVFNYTLPTGQSITYSSPFHIGQYYESTDKFVGDEAGAYPWQQVNKSFNVYNVDELAAFVTLREPF